LRGVENIRLRVQKTRKIEKVTGSRDDKGDGSASPLHRLMDEPSWKCSRLIAYADQFASRGGP